MLYFILTMAIGAHITPVLTSCNTETEDTLPLVLTALAAVEDYRINSLLNEEPVEHGLFAIAGNDGTIYTSHDGLEWTQHQHGLVDLNGIGMGNNLIVAVGDRGKIVSTDGGSTWELHTKETDNLRDITYGNRQFVAVGDNGKRVSSRDGRVWNNEFSGGKGLYAVTWSGDLYLAAGEQGRTTFSSTSGGKWSDGTVSTFKDLVYDVDYTGAQYVAVGENGMRARSADGENWTLEKQNQGANLTGIAYNGNDLFVAVGYYGRTVISSDFTTWNHDSTKGSDTTHNLNSVTYGMGKFLAAGNAGQILSSQDGISWKEVHRASTRLNHISYTPSYVQDDSGETTGVCHTHWHRHENIDINEKNNMHRHWHCHEQTQRKDVHDHIH